MCLAGLLDVILEARKHRPCIAACQSESSTVYIVKDCVGRVQNFLYHLQCMHVQVPFEQVSKSQYFQKFSERKDFPQTRLSDALNYIWMSLFTHDLSCQKGSRMHYWNMALCSAIKAECLLLVKRHTWLNQRTWCSALALHGIQFNLWIGG